MDSLILIGETATLEGKMHQMQHTFFIQLRLAGTLLLFSAQVFGQTGPANPNASERTRCVLEYFALLPSRPENKVISGQMLDVALLPPAAFDSAIVRIFSRTGKWVGIVGANYQRTLAGVPSLMGQVNSTLITYVQQGGLASVMCSFSNPWTNANSGDTTGTSSYLDIITAGTVANAAWLQRLDSVAVGLGQLQDSGVTVLWRPLHEMNGTWFWWGAKNPPGIAPTPAQYAAVWQHMFNYLTYTKQLNNLLWVYAPAARETGVSNPNFKSETYYYPGGTFVDIVGVDVYNDTLDIPNFAAIRALGKPMAIAEFGPKKTASGLPPFVYDYTILINQIRSKHPEFVYWMSWNDFITNGGATPVYYAMGNQNNISELLQDSWVGTREDLQSSLQCTSVSVQYSPSWNLIANPVLTSNDSAHIIFPQSTPATSFAYGCGSGYTFSGRCVAGQGYWLKFPSKGSTTLQGIRNTQSSITVCSGWNLIGSLSVPLAATSVSAIGTTFLSPFYRFSDGYVRVDTLMPGVAHWIKVSESGTIVLNADVSLFPGGNP